MYWFQVREWPSFYHFGDRVRVILDIFAWRSAVTLDLFRWLLGASGSAKANTFF